MPEVISRDTVFVFGGQPSITYVERAELDIGRQFARSVASPFQITSLAGPTKCGKTVLCRKELSGVPYVWIEGGQIKTAVQLWERVCYELNYSLEIQKSGKGETKGEIGAGFPFVMSGTLSHLSSQETKRTYRIDNMATAIRHLLENKIILVIDDFHYPPEEMRIDFLRNIKGAVFAGLKIILLSVTHRAFDAIKAEAELTGRFSSTIVPEWSREDLKKIPEKGFRALNVNCDGHIIDRLAIEAQKSPFLMQKFCWDICYDKGVNTRAASPENVPKSYSLETLFKRIAKDSGLPIYRRLVAGPQSRTDRIPRPLKSGGEVDIYEATLRAISESGPKETLTYDEIRTQLNNILADKIPQKNEVTFALGQLSEIAHKLAPQFGSDSPLDWVDGTLTVDDPYLRFFLRWQIRQEKPSGLFS